MFGHFNSVYSVRDMIGWFNSSYRETDQAAVGGFTPASGVSGSGTFADGQSFTFTVPGGGLGARTNPKALYYWEMGEHGGSSLATHATLSRTSFTFSPYTNNTFIQSTVAPPNAAGACQYIPSFGPPDRSLAFSNYPTVTGGGGYVLYAFVKHYWGMSQPPENDKFWRLWATQLGGFPDAYSAISKPAGDFVLAVEANDNATNLPAGGHFVAFPHTDPGVTGAWWTREHFWKENTFGNSDGVHNMALQGVLAFPLNTTFGPTNSNNGNATNPTGAGPMNTLFLDQYTVNTPGDAPNGTTDTGYYGIIYIDDSSLQVVITDEGSAYSTAVVNSTGSNFNANINHREIQPQTARSDTAITITIRRGSLSKGVAYNVLAVTGYGTAVNLGTGTF